jgi:hypothetical protein
LAAAEQTADGFFVRSPNPDATNDSRLLRLWNARRNPTHGFGGDAEILADHSGLLPADVVLVPMVYLLDLLTDREGATQADREYLPLAPRLGIGARIGVMVGRVRLGYQVAVPQVDP